MSKKEQPSESTLKLDYNERVRTEVLSADDAGIARAAQIIRSGGLVAFPTETVYGLGADALNENAVKKIFLAKERPLDDPLIVHIAHMDDLKRVAQHVSEQARELAQRFWPGPLTLVLPKDDRVPSVTTGSLETIAVRAPAHPVACKLIQASGCPIAAPSANRFGRPSPTCAEHVLQDLDGRIDLILDGGPTPIGVESTVLDLTQSPPMILRPGGVTLEELQKVLGEVRSLDSAHPEAARRSPGTRYRHYAPRAKLVLIDRGQSQKVIESLRGKRVGVLTSTIASPLGGPGEGVYVKLMPTDLREYARRLFATIRELDNVGVDVIAVEKVEEIGLGRAIMDRLRRAAQREDCLL